MTLYAKWVDYTGEAESDYSYKVLSNGTVQITGYKGTRGHITIPDTLGGKTVSEIGASAFKNKSEILWVVVPESVHTIRANAFQGCTKLTVMFKSAALPSILSNGLGTAAVCANVQSYGVTKYGQVYAITNDGGAIAGRYHGSEEILMIPSEINGFPVVEVGQRAFSGKSTMTQITMPDGIEVIGCEKLVDVVIPQGVKRIEASAFYDCESLIGTVVPESVEFIGASAFGSMEKTTVMFKSDMLPKELAEGWNGTGKVYAGVCTNVDRFGTTEYGQFYAIKKDVRRWLAGTEERIRRSWCLQRLRIVP